MSIDCILQIFYRAITVSNCTHLYMWPLYVHTLSRSPLIFMRAHLNPRGGPGNIQGITDRSARGCACVPVCVGMREYPFLWNQHYDYWRIVAYLATRSFATTLFTQQWRLQLYQAKRMILLIKAGAITFIKYEYLCINSPPKARMQWFVKKVQSDVSQNC